MTLREASRAAAARLAGVPLLRERAVRDAEFLLLYALNLPRTALLSDPLRQVSEPEQAQFDTLIVRRLAFEPIQYITGEQEFFGLPFHVNMATLIPRPETELLVEAVLARLPRDQRLDLLDVGTGSGAIAVALAYALPHAKVFAVDLSAAALEVAQANAKRNGIGDRITFRVSDLLAAVPPGTRFDAIISNPPYVPEADRPTLHPEVREYEPEQALFAGADGLELYRRLIPQACHILRPGGLLALEIGFGQAQAIARLLESWTAVEFLDDLQAIPRVALAHQSTT